MADIKKENNIIYLGPPEKIQKKADKKIDKKNKNNFQDKKADETETANNIITNPIWLSVSETAKICGVNQKTIRRAIQAKQINYKIYKDRYLLNLSAVIEYMHSNKKLLNKFKQYGLGQYLK